jgi:hypothetical protein
MSRPWEPILSKNPTNTESEDLVKWIRGYRKVMLPSASATEVTMSTENQQESHNSNVSPLEWGKTPYKARVARNAFISLVIIGIGTLIARCLLVGRKTMVGLQLSEPSLSSGRLVYRTFSKMAETYRATMHLVTEAIAKDPLQSFGIVLGLYIVLFLYHRRHFFAARKRKVADLVARMRVEDWDRLAKRYGFSHLRG